MIPAVGVLSLTVVVWYCDLVLSLAVVAIYCRQLLSSTIVPDTPNFRISICGSVSVTSDVPPIYMFVNVAVDTV